MNAKEYLQQVKALDIKIKQKEEQYRSLKAAASSVGAVRYDNEIVQTSKSPDKLERLVIRYIDLGNQIEDERLKFQTLKQKIINEIQQLPDSRHIALLYKRYVEYKSYEQIADEMAYSFPYVKELHQKSLSAFESSYPILLSSVL